MASPRPSDYDAAVDLKEFFLRLIHGLPQIVGLALVGLVFSLIGTQLLGPRQSSTKFTRISFSFNGFEHGLYPDQSKFEADDLRAADLISEAASRVSMEVDGTLLARLRAAVSVEAVIPSNITRERDRLRASGQTPPRYIADEYSVSLTLPRSFPMDDGQRRRFLNELVSAFRDRFQRTYAKLPGDFGNVFQTLRGADYFEYEFILSSDLQNLNTFLQKQIQSAPTFRSQTTNLTFADLLRSSELFTQLRLNEVLGLIRANGISRDRKLAMVKIDYHLSRLEERERQAVEEERVVTELMARTQDRSQNYVLGIRSQAQQRPDSNAPIVDQGLIDSLLQNDAYNFLMRRALDAGLAVKAIQAEKARLLERRKAMEAFLSDDRTSQASAQQQLEQTLANLESGYMDLVEKVQTTFEDFAKREYADAVRISGQINSESVLRSIALAGIVGAFLGGALGGGLSLLGIYIGRGRKAA
jgi:hypothetical protein